MTTIIIKVSRLLCFSDGLFIVEAMFDICRG